MKKKFLIFVLTLLVCLSGLALIGCSDDPPTTDYNANLQTVAPEDIDTEHFVPEEDTTYYTSSELFLCIEVNGEYMIMDYFSLDGDKRVYDNLYLYVEDYFYMITGDYNDIYASLSDSTSTEYAEEEKEQGYDIQINVKKAGIYKLTFDVKTLEFDMIYKAEIQTPVYYTIKNCSIYSLATDWVEMSANPENTDEFVINNFNVEAGKTISFFNNLHVSNYKVTLADSVNDKLASARKTLVTVNVGGNYNVYINRKTYVVRMELLNPDTATYSCVYYDGTDFNELTPYDQSVPYVFRQRVVVTTQFTTSLPDFHSKSYTTYDLTVVDTFDVLLDSTEYSFFKQPGTYDVIVNLKTFEITAEKLPD